MRARFGPATIPFILFRWGPVMSDELIHIEAHVPERRQKRSEVLVCVGCCCCCCLNYLGALVGAAVATAPATSIAPRRITAVLLYSWGLAVLVTLLLLGVLMDVAGGPVQDMVMYLLLAPATPLISGPLVMLILGCSPGPQRREAMKAAAVIAGGAVLGALLGWLAMVGVYGLLP